MTDAAGSTERELPDRAKEQMDQAASILNEAFTRAGATP